MKIYCTILLLTTVLQLHAQLQNPAQEVNKVNHDNKYGLYVGYGHNSHTANFTRLPGIPNCCPQFESGSGTGIYFGLLYERKLFDNFWFGTRFSFLERDGTLQREEQTTILTLNGPRQGVFEHTISSIFMNLAIEPSVMYNFFADGYISLGASVGYTVASTFEQQEQIVSPVGFGTFIDANGNDTRSRVRNEFAGDIPNVVSLQMGLTASISYELPLNKEKNLRFAPELSYYLPLTNVAEGTDWQIHTLKGIFAVKYSPSSSSENTITPIREYKIDTIVVESDIISEQQFKQGKEHVVTEKRSISSSVVVVETTVRTDTILRPKAATPQKKYTLDAKITYVGIDSNGREIENPVYQVEEFISNRLDPLLNYIFFDDGSAEIPSRYKKRTVAQRENFLMDSLYFDSTLTIYYNILDIVGLRMQTHQQANLRLVGCNSDIGTEKNNILLSEQRANSIKTYLTSVWNIAPERITVQTRNLPEKPSTPATDSIKIAENRRVELYSDDENILAPIFLEKTDWRANPPIIRFKPEATAEAGVRHWRISAYQLGGSASQYVYESGDSVLIAQDWILGQIQKITPRLSAPITYSLEVEDNRGNISTDAGQTQPIEIITLQQRKRKREGNFDVEKFSLILFDFDKATIMNSNQSIIEFIKKRITPGSEVEIKGYTDKSGDADYNKKLSLRRAEAVQSALQYSSASVTGIGADKLLYDNTLPEARFYCRTVEITVKTLIK